MTEIKNKLFDVSGYLWSAIGTGLFFLLGIIGKGLRDMIRELKDDSNKHDDRLDALESRVTGIERESQMFYKSVDDKFNAIKEMIKDLKIELKR